MMSEESQEAARDPTPDSPASIVVGIGASAGGLTALRELFSRIPEETGAAWVVVVHLSPEHESHLADLLQSHARMPVVQVRETVELEADRVYVIPPGANLSAVDTHLRVSALEDGGVGRAPIDHFFRTLASTHDGHAVGVILTGTGSDGALGIKAVKERHGMVVVQDPGEAEYDSMPQSAIATGMADLVLPLADIPDAILRFAGARPRLPLPAADGQELAAETRRLLQSILAQVRTRTGRNFSRYKPSTLLRRIHRRMQLLQIEEPEAYLNRLRSDAEEVGALADDVLITVTNFFRDGEVWEQLATEVIPGLFESRRDGEAIRVWSVGCATGEEAYSLAILLLEEADRRNDAPEAPLQVFASDLHDHSVSLAREGFYPGDIEEDVSPERLKRFFHREDGGYRVRSELRERVVFAPHDLLGDPPFSRIDLISCRNVLIYLGREAQQDVLELFHYALRPDGYLLFGTSETAEDSGLFRTVDGKRCLFRRRNVRSAEPRLPVFGAVRTLAMTRPQVRPERGDETLAYGTLHRGLLERHGPPSLLVGPNYDIVHLSDAAGRFLVHPGGEPTRNVFRLVREELRFELRSALHAARERAEATRSRPIPVRLNGEEGSVVVDVRPAPEAEHAGFSLIIFEDLPTGSDAAGHPENAAREDVEAGGAGDGARQEAAGTDGVESELMRTRQRLQTVIEEFETSKEETRASHEELQSSNEELRSTMEELETSKEELQSLNEELQTVNQENRHKVEELTQLSADLRNLLAATDIATLFLDRKLRILRFTPQVAELFNVRPADRGRPISDLTSRLGYHELGIDAEAVLETLIPVEREVEDEEGRWYLARVLPYRSGDRIEGVVVTLVDISERKRSEEEVREAKVYAESIVATLHEPLLVLTPDLRVKSVNQAFYDQFEVEEKATVGRKIYDLGNGQWDIPELRTLLEDVLPDSKVFNDYEVRHTFEDIGERIMLLNGRRLDHVQLILLGVRDVTDKKQIEEALRESEERQAFLLKLSDALRPLADPVEIQASAAGVVGEHLGSDRAYYVEIDEPNQEFVVARDWHRPGSPSHTRRYPLADWPMPWLTEGETWVVSNVDTDPTMPDDQRDSYRGNDIGAAVVVPLIKEGRLVATFITNQRAPRNWKPEEVSLVEETAERTWAAVEQARAEWKRWEAEKRYLALFNSIDQGFCTIELIFGDDGRPIDYRFLEVSPSFEKHSGIQSAVGRTMREIAPDHDEHWFEFYGRVARERQPARTESYSTPLDRWWTAYAFPVGETHQRRVAVLFTDITERKRAEEALRESEERHRLIVECARDYAILTADLEGRIESWSPGAEAIYGWTVAEIVGEPVEITFTTEDREAGVPGENLETARSEGAAPDVRWHVRNDGSRVFIDGTTRTLRDADGEVRGFLKIGQDVTERRRAEEALQENERRFRQMAEVVPDAVFTTTPDGVVDYVSPRREELIGHGPENALGTRMWPELIHPDDRSGVQARLDAALSRQEPFDARYRLRMATGEYCWFIARARPIVTGDGELVRWFGTLSDVDELTRAEGAIRELNETLEARVEERTAELEREVRERLRAEEARREVLQQLITAEEAERQRISRELHDQMGQQLTGLLLGLRSLRDLDPAEQRPRLENLESLAGTISRDMQSLALELRPPALDSMGLIPALRAHLEEWAERHGIEHDFHDIGVDGASSELETTVYRVVQEGLTNVLKHAAASRVGLIVERRDGMVHVILEDDGSGFDVDAVLSSPEKARSLGVRGMRERVARLDGEIEIESTPGNGTTLFVRIPVLEDLSSGSGGSS